MIYPDRPCTCEVVGMIYCERHPPVDPPIIAFPQTGPELMTAFAGTFGSSHLYELFLLPDRVEVHLWKD